MNRTISPVVLAVAPPGEGSALDAQTFLGRMPNIGILYVASSLEQAGYASVVLDRHYDRPTPFQLAAEILSHNPSVIGFSLFDLTMNFTKRTLEIIRVLFRGDIIVGGYTATFHAEDILNYWPEVNYVLLRESERSMVQFMRFLKGDLRIDQVPNLVWRQDKGIRQNRPDSQVDVRTLPWPRRCGEESQDVIPMVTRRGCASACSFCSMVSFYERDTGQVVRYRDIPEVVDEIEDCLSCGITELMFYDDDFGLATDQDREWADGFVDAISQRQLHFQFGIELRVVDIIRGADQLDRLSRIGMSHLAIGMESLLPRQLQLYRKGHTQAQIFRAIEVVERLTSHYQTNVMFWDPFVTMDEAAEHLCLLDKINIYDQLASVNYPFYASTLSARKGTRIHADLMARGLLKQSKHAFYRFEYQFQDSETRAFHTHILPDFLDRTHRAIKRPPPLWMLVPRLQFAGETSLAHELKLAGQRLAKTEFDYFRRLIELARTHGAGDRHAPSFIELHEEMARSLADCANAFPAIPKTVLDHVRKKAASANSSVEGKT